MPTLVTRNVSMLQMHRLLELLQMSFDASDPRWVWQLHGPIRLVLTVEQDGVTYYRNAARGRRGLVPCWLTASDTSPVWINLGAIDEKLLITTPVPAAISDIHGYAAWIRDQSRRHGFALHDLFQVQARLIFRLLTAHNPRHRGPQVPAIQVYPRVLEVSGIVRPT